MASTEQQVPALRRELGFWGTASLSIGVMAPTLAMSITGSAAAGLVGAAAPLAFAVAAVGVLVVSSGFVRLSAEIPSAGSVYSFVGRALGPRAGFLTGWAMLGTYLVFPWVSVSGIAVFAQAFLDVTGLAPGTDWIIPALAGWALIWWLAARRIRPTSRSLLVFEAVAVLLILALMVLVFVRLGTRGGPRGQTFTADVVQLPSSVGVSTIALAATVGFLAFAGFESAGSLGEEAHRPGRFIPRAMLAAIALGGVFYVACMLAQSWGFGTDKAGVAAFAGSSAPLGELALDYAGAPMAAVLDLVAVISAVGAGLGCVVVAVRMLYALGRDRMLPQALAAVSPVTGTPTVALRVEMALGLVTLIAFRLAGTTPIRVFFFLATFGVLNLLVMYAATNYAAVRHLWPIHPRSALLPAVGVVVAGYVLVRNVWPPPEGTLRVVPYLVIAWLTVGAVRLALHIRSSRVRMSTRPRSA